MRRAVPGAVLCAALWGCEPWVIELPSPSAPVTDSPPSTDPLSLPGAGPVPAEPCARACTRSAAWEVVREWETDAGALDQLSPPVIAHLDDDGLPEVVVSSGSQLDSTEIAVWRGDGAPGYALPGAFYPWGAEPAAGDLDGDGDAELVALRGSARRPWLQAMQADGTVLWQSEVLTPSEASTVPLDPCEPVIADLEGDGQVEVICHLIVLEGATGETRLRLPLDLLAPNRTTAVADLDRDGWSEIVSGRQIWRADGTLAWEASLAEDADEAYPTALDLDEDADLEVLLAEGRGLLAYDTDGSPLWQALGGPASPPCVADFDGDGELELVSTSGGQLAMIERDGTVAWSRAADDPSRLSCFGFDFDQDGQAEIAFAGAESFALYCGSDGVELYRDPVSAFRAPLVADLDRDGSAEVLLARISGPDAGTGVVVYGQRDDQWPATGETWPQQQHAPSGGTTTSRPTDGPVLQRSPTQGLGLALLDQQGDCEGRALSVRVENTGDLAVPAGRILQVRAVDRVLLGQMSQRSIREIELPEVLPRTALAALRLDLSAEESGAWGLQLEILPVPDVYECDPADESLLLYLPCEI